MPLNLEIFTACTRGRYELNRVFVKGGRRWATDGVVLVGEKASDEKDTIGDFPDPKLLFKGFPKNEALFKKIELPLESDGERGVTDDEAQLAIERAFFYVWIDGGKYNLHYVALLLLLPGLRVHNQADFDRSGARRLCFLWDRGAGILMGVDD